MASRISDITRGQIKKRIKEQPGADKGAIAAEFRVSLGTVKRLAKEVKDAQGVPPASVHKAKVRAATKAALGKLPDKGAISAPDFRQILVTLLEDLSTATSEAPVKSREGGARAAAELMRCYREFYPPTIDEAIDHLLTLPDFDPLEFARRLRARYEQAS